MAATKTRLQILGTHAIMADDLTKPNTMKQAQLMKKVCPRNEEAKIPSLILHESLGHPAMKQQINKNKAFHQDVTNRNQMPFLEECDACTMARSTKARLPIHTTEPKKTQSLDRLHIDILSAFSGHSVYKNALIIKDEASAFLHAVPMKNNGQFVQALIDFVTGAEYQIERTCKVIRSDNDSTSLSNLAIEWAANKVSIRVSAPYDSRLNGKVEQANRTVRERCQANLFAREVFYSLWPEAMKYAVTQLDLVAHREGATPF